MSEPFKTLCISARLRQATRQANALYDAALAPHGINIAQFSLLRTIQRIDRPTLNQLSKDTGLDASTLGRNTRVLERAGLVQLEAGTDKRTRVLSLTENGLRISRAAKADWDAVQSDLKTRLGPGGYNTLFQLLDALDAHDKGLQQ